MKTASVVLGLATLTSLGLHLGGVHLFWDDEAKIEGGAPVSDVRLGNSFQDVVNGIAEPVEPEEEIEQDVVEELVESDQTEEMNQLEKADQVVDAEHPQEQTEAEVSTESLMSEAPRDLSEPETPSETQTADTPTLIEQTPTPSETIAALQSSAPVTLTPDSTSAVPLTSSNVTNIIEAEPVPVVPVTPQELTPAELTPTTLQATKPQTLEALRSDESASETVQVSSRPARRPPEVEAKAAQAEKEQRERQQQTQTAQRQGSQAQEQRRGQNDGRAQAQQAERSEQVARATRQAGNAAASNYRGIVQRKIARQREPRARGKGRVVVSFSIANNGALSSIRVSRSSGRSDIDKAALQMVRRAAPFPAPPAGAPRQFNQGITIGR
ncbi:MAG: TonB family protein [Litoreibacter sp.]|nr:TonB family protein [Litoreibacter sp.]